jgi:hypothetical protein
MDMPALGKFTPGVTVAASVAAALAYLGHLDYAIGALLVLNALWMLVYSWTTGSRAARWCWLLVAVLAVSLAWCVMTRPSAAIILASPVDQTTAVAITFNHIPLDQRLWLVIAGTSGYWPYGTCDVPPGSLVERSRQVLQQQRGAWTFPDLVVGSNKDAGAHFSLMVLLVDASTDALLANEFKTHSESCGHQPWLGLSTLPRTTILATRDVYRRAP